MTAADEEARRRAERARRVALFQYELIQEVIDPSLSTRQHYDALMGQPTQPGQADPPTDGQIAGQLDLTDLLSNQPGTDQPGEDRPGDGEEAQ